MARTGTPRSPIAVEPDWEKQRLRWGRPEVAGREQHA